MNAERFALALVLAVVLSVLAATVGGGAGGDIAVSGKLRHKALFQVGDAPATDYDVSTLRYIVEAPPSTVGEVVPLDVGVVDSLCRDKDGCQVSLQLVQGASSAEPGMVRGEEGWLFLSEVSDWFRIGHIGSHEWKYVEGEDDSYGADYLTSYLTTVEWRDFDCIFTPAESVIDAGDNGRSDDLPGFGLLNCENLGEPENCDYDDLETTCRILFID